MTSMSTNKRARSKLREARMDDLKNSVSTKHSVQPGTKISPRNFKLYHQAIENPYNTN